MAAGTLGLVSWAEPRRLAVARTMGMVTFALFLLFFSIESKDDRESAFSAGTFSDRTFARTTAGPSSCWSCPPSWASSTP